MYKLLKNLIPRSHQNKIDNSPINPPKKKKQRSRKITWFFLKEHERAVNDPVTEAISGSRKQGGGEELRSEEEKRGGKEKRVAESTKSVFTRLPRDYSKESKRRVFYRALFPNLSCLVVSNMGCLDVGLRS